MKDDNMTWEDTIKYIRTQPEYTDLVEKAYFDEDLKLNVSRFGKSEEFIETLTIISRYAPKAKTILDIGSGNGISAINFALKGYDLTVVEPDESKTIGAGAIRILKEDFKLDSMTIHEDYAENINFSDNSFDIVYVRQAMHHANDLQSFLKECVRVLKPGGLLLTVRDHVVTSNEDKEWFFKAHALQKFYGGENAFKAQEYSKAITDAGAKIIEELKYYDSIINFFPKTKADIDALRQKNIKKRKQKLKEKIGVIATFPFVWDFYLLISRYEPLNENAIPGRMYSYIAIKK